MKRYTVILNFKNESNSIEYEVHGKSELQVTIQALKKLNRPGDFCLFTISNGNVFSINKRELLELVVREAYRSEEGEF